MIHSLLFSHLLLLSSTINFLLVSSSEVTGQIWVRSEYFYATSPACFGCKHSLVNPRKIIYLKVTLQWQTAWQPSWHCARKCSRRQSKNQPKSSFYESLFSGISEYLALFININWFINISCSDLWKFLIITFWMCNSADPLLLFKCFDLLQVQNASYDFLHIINLHKML